MPKSTVFAPRDKMLPAQSPSQRDGGAIMTDKKEFLEKWMRSEALKKAAPQKAPAQPMAKRSAGPAAGGAAAESVPDATLEMAAPPALVPFADMDFWYLSNEMPWMLVSTGKTIHVPRGFVTDFASVPSTFWAWMPPTGRYGLPAIVHDWLYWEQSLPRSAADDIFYNALSELGVSNWRRFVIYRTVRWFGGKYWRENTTAKANGEGRVLKLFPNDARITWTAWRTRPGVFV